jgi:hypothetical protein
MIIVSKVLNYLLTQIEREIGKFYENVYVKYKFQSLLLDTLKEDVLKRVQIFLNVNGVKITI